MFQHHPLLSTLQLDDVCAHAGKFDSSMMEAFQHAPQLTSLTLRHLCTGILDANLLHLRRCYSLKELTIECLSHRFTQVRLILSGLDLQQLNIHTYDKQPMNRTMEVSHNLIAWNSRHLFLRDYFISPWNGLSRLYADHPYASIGKGLRLEVDDKRSCIGEPLQFRIVADRLFRVGEAVTWYGGLPIHKPNFKVHRLPKTHAREIPSTDYALDGLPLAQMLNRPILNNLEQLLWAVTHVDQLRPDQTKSNNCPFTASEIKLWCDTPIGYMINTASVGEVNNLRIKYVSFAHRTCSIPVLHAVREIQPNEELLCPYNQF